MSKPERRPTITWADDQTQLTHYDPNGHALLLCVMCLEDETREKIGQAITITEGEAVCEDHLFPTLDDVIADARDSAKRALEDLEATIKKIRERWSGTYAD